MNTDIVSEPGRLPETPWEAVEPITREEVMIEGRTFVIHRPEDSDRVARHPAIRSAIEADTYLPMWTDLWPAARMLAKAILREQWSPGLEALELGCGLGLPGIAALAAGMRVIFSDCDATALRFAADNARANGFDNFRTLQFDWQHPPSDLKVPVLIASDLIYELKHIDPIVRLMKQVLLPDGVCLMTDQNRLPSYNFHDVLDAERLAYTERIVRAGEPGGRRVKGTLYRITHKP